jgi:(1->4)-alpha-D-glucan 1-alpha-D-glucosylmutase
MEQADVGLPKMWTIHQALQLRLERPEWFGAWAAYTPLDVEGPKAEHVIAYLRGDAVATVVPRLTTKVAGGWRRTTVALPAGRWVNRLTNSMVEGGKVLVEGLLKDFPVALLVRDGSGETAGDA